MPLFAYTCTACGAESELLVRGSETPHCPACESEQLEKQLSHIRPLQAGAPEPVGCGASQCCRMPGGGCAN